MNKPTIYTVEDIYEITEDYESRKFVSLEDYEKLETLIQQGLSGSDNKSSSPKYQCSNCLEHYFYVTESGLCQGYFDAETQNKY